MKKIFNKYKILIITSIIIILAGTTVIVLSQWSPPYAIIPLSTDHVSPQGRYDIISARQYFDLDDPTYMLDPTGESFVKDIRAQEITCAEIRGVIHGRTDRDLDGTGKNRYVMFHSTTGIPAVVPPYCDALLYTLNVEQDINVGGTYDYDGDGTRDLYYDYKKDDGSNEDGIPDITAPGIIYMGTGLGNTGKHVYDIAEGIKGKGVELADVVIIDPEQKDRVKTTDISYDLRVAGVISSDPGIYLASGENRYPLSLKGKTYCKVTSINGAIIPGDLLVTSAKRGYAMRGELDKIKPGMVIGKALEGLSEGEGKILIWVSPG